MCTSGSILGKKIKKKQCPPTHCLGKGSGKNISTCVCLCKKYVVAYCGGTETVPLEKRRLSKKITFGASVKNMGGAVVMPWRGKLNIDRRQRRWRTKKQAVCTEGGRGGHCRNTLVVFLTKQEINCNRKLTTLFFFSFITAFFGSFGSYQMFCSFPQQERQTKNNIKDEEKTFFF